MGRRVPFYEYRRQDGTTFEVMQKMVDPPLEVDPETGLPVTRVFHPIAVHFKGKGFYNTDYGTKKRAREKEATEKASDASSDAKTDKTSDAKAGSSASSDGAAKSSSAGTTSAKPAKPD
jgi:predicted nucleic acid-binding Zn ribbon protein